MNPFSAIFVPDDLADALSDRAWLEALLQAELALVNACARANVVPAASATAIADACRADLYDVQELAEAGRAPGNPVEPLVRAIRAHVGGAHAQHVHRGATSQDILDSASMLIARGALGPIDTELKRAAEACAELAAEHRRTVMAARTLLQQAVPTTFGYKAAGWLVGLAESRRTLAGVAGSLPAQLGGAGGTLAALGADGIDVHAQFAVELGLREPTVPWHTIRTPVAELAGALAGAAGVVGKVASDIVLLAQTEVAEVAERTPGGSSTMPHKRNPVAAVLAGACVRHARANSALLLESVVQEHERAVGAWHAEWHALVSALAATGGAVASLGRSLDGLEVDVNRMRANVAAETLSEARGLGFDDVVSPDEYLGSTDAFIDRALALHRG
jgi:3-carboxy-cis,cis-muconate cycloisomerase